MNYETEKLKSEYTELIALWKKIKDNWEKKSLDSEDLYRIYPFLTTTAAISRKYIHWNKDLNFEISIVEPSLKTGVDTSIYLYYDETKFFNGYKKTLPLYDVTSSLLHQIEFSYMDNRKIDGKMTTDTEIYLFARSDKLCESCALTNNGEYRGNGKDFKKTVMHIEYSDCLCGYYMNIDSYLNNIEKLIKKVTKVTSL